MKLLRLILPVLLFCHALASAAPLDELAQRLARNGGLRGEFTQEKQLQGLSKPLISSGQFLYQPSGALLWRIEKPYASDALITGNQLIQQLRGKTISRIDVRSQPGYSAVARIFLALIGNDLKALQQDFDLKLQQQGARWQLELTPKGGLFASFARTLTLKGQQQLDSLEILERNGDSTRYQFRKQAALGSLSAQEQALFQLR